MKRRHLIVAVATLNIVASLILLVMEKTRDIGLLKAMGAAPRQRGNSDAWIFRHPLAGASSTHCGKISP